MESIKAFMKKVANVIGYVYGYGIMICLFAGGATFFGYMAAFIIGGDVAAEICNVIYKKIFPIIILASTVTVLLGVLKMYLSGEVALTIDKKRKKSRDKRLSKKAKREAEKSAHEDVVENTDISASGSEALAESGETDTQEENGTNTEK